MPPASRRRRRLPCKPRARSRTGAGAGVAPPATSEPSCKGGGFHDVRTVLAMRNNFQHQSNSSSFMATSDFERYFLPFVQLSSPPSCCLVSKTWSKLATPIINLAIENGALILHTGSDSSGAFHAIHPSKIPTATSLIFLRSAARFCDRSC